MKPRRFDRLTIFSINGVSWIWLWLIVKRAGNMRVPANGGKGEGTGAGGGGFNQASSLSPRRVTGRKKAAPCELHVRRALRRLENRGAYSTSFCVPFGPVDAVAPTGTGRCGLATGWTPDGGRRAGDPLPPTVPGGFGIGAAFGMPAAAGAGAGAAEGCGTG